MLWCDFNLSLLHIFDPLLDEGLPKLRFNEILLAAKPKYLDTCPCMIEVSVIAKYKDCFSNDKKKKTQIIVDLN